jgi:S-formylglutathione hydrolase
LGVWTGIEIAGKRADVFEPTSGGPYSSAVLHLHGHGLETLKDKPAFTKELERHGLPTLCPHGQRSWWLDTVCREFDASVTPLAWLRERVVPFMTARWNVRPPRIGVMGISMGGQGALQLAYRHARDFPVVAAISPAVDFHNWHGRGLPLDKMFGAREAARQQTATLHVHPLNWPKHQLLVCDPADSEWFEGCERLASKLRSIGVPFEADLQTSAGGHSWDYFNAMAPAVVRFVAERLSSA